MFAHGSGRNTCLEQPVLDAASALGREFSCVVASYVMLLDFTDSKLSLFLFERHLKYSLCAHLQGISGFSSCFWPSLRTDKS